MNRILACSLLIFLCPAYYFAQLPAFPGAQGFGAFAKGGRGGKVIYVTNVNDHGSGSLRAAVEADGPRTVVFAVSGIIDLESSLTLKNPYITIAGQTAPGDGICLRGETVRIETHDVILRHLRFRLGDGQHGQGSLQGKDALSIVSGRDIIIDHCSTSWSLDEVLSASTRQPSLTHVTVQWCFITEALNPDNHGYGSLIRGTGGAKYSFLNNLYAHNRGRNPRPGNYDSNPHNEDPEGLLLDFSNNVIYNWGGHHAGYNSDTSSVTQLNYIGNYLIPGKNSTPNGFAYATGSRYNRAYFNQNYYNHQLPDHPWRVVRYAKQWQNSDIQNYQQAQAFEVMATEYFNAIQAYQLVLAHGGASLPRRDKVDNRIVTSVKNQTGQIIQSQREVGGWPTYESFPPPQDSDKDGMPDEWEKQRKLDPHNANDAHLLHPSGYTMLEWYLNNL